MTPKSTHTPACVSNLQDEFGRISRDHKNLVAQHASRVVLFASVMRVFAPGTKGDLLSLLPELPLDDLKEIKDQEGFEKWFGAQLNRVARRILVKNRDNSKINPGYKWGHASKILNLYLREMVLNSRYFNDRDARRLSFFLYVPIDSKIMARLRKLGCRLPFSRIKEISSKGQFMLVQSLLAEAAVKAKAPRIWFDYVWSEI